MSAQSMIDQLLKTGLAAVNDARGSLLGGSQPGDMRKYATGAAAGGVLAVLLGPRSSRGIGGSMLKLGSMSALGMLAWKTYQDWQAQQQAASGAPMSAPPSAPPALPPPQAEQHDRVLLNAMIAAAKSDNHLDHVERDKVEAELRRAESDDTLRAWVETELRRPVNAADVAAEVAASVTTPELAAEVYLASVLVVDQSSPQERAYLDALASALRLNAGLKAQLEVRALAT